VPASVWRDCLEPGWHDARRDYLAARSDDPRALARWRARLTYGLALVLLLVDGWGLSALELPGAARRAALRLVNRFPREPVVMIRYHLRHAARRLLREPAFTAVAGLTLALGIGGSVAVFAVVEAVLLRPLPYPDADRLVIVKHQDERTGITKEFVAIGDYVDLAARQTAFDRVGSYGAGGATIFGQGEPIQVAALYADGGTLDALGAEVVMGRGLRPEGAVVGAAPVMLLGHELWRQRFGSDSLMVGRSLRLGTETRTVVGILAPSFHFPVGARTDVVLSVDLPAAAPAERKAAWTFALARLKPGLPIATAAADLRRVAGQLAAEYPETNRASTYFPVSLRDQAVGDTRPALLLLLAAVAAVLLIACGNVANLLLARSVGRRQEMALRLTLGASRGRLAGQLLLESFTLATIAGVVGVGFAKIGARALVLLASGSIRAPGLDDVVLDGPVLAFALLVTTATALTFGAVSTVTLNPESLATTLIGSGRSSSGGRARRASVALVVGEVAFAVTLLFAAGLIVKSFAGLLSIDPGFDPERVLTVTVDLPADRYAALESRDGLYRRAFPAIRRLPGIQEVGAAVVVPLTGNNWTAPFERADQPVRVGERPPEVGWQVASGGYFAALKIPLVRGRLFDERDGPTSPRIAIVSRAIERRFFAGESAVGRSIRLGPDEVEIVGVVGDIRRAGLTDDPRADLYFPFERQPSTEITLFIRTAGAPLAALPPIRAALRELEPDLVLRSPRSMAEVAASSVELTRLLVMLLGAFAAVALVLAAIGIYSVMSYVVRQRTREIGTRIALGAGTRDILWLVLREAAAIAGTGTTIGVGIGLATSGVLRSQLYQVSAADPLVVAGATAVLAAAALVASMLPALRAASVDPARTLADPTT
jgi:putative ABC transport system permease protein